MQRLRHPRGHQRETRGRRCLEKEGARRILSGVAWSEGVHIDDDGGGGCGHEYETGGTFVKMTRRTAGSLI